MANALANIKKGDKVIMRLFTGAFSGVKEVEKADKSFIYFTTGKGMSKFSKKTGKMVDPAPKSERFANYIEEFDADVAKAEETKKSKSLKKAAKAKAVKAEAKAKATEEELEEDEDDLEEEEEEAPKKKAAKKIKKVVKKVAKKVVEDEEENDEDEDDDDDDVEEM